MKDQGLFVEDYARRLAGDLGVPDFVYRPIHLATGSGVREAGDGLLVVGEQGLVVQVKSRERNVGQEDSPERAASWCLKAGLQAQRQGRGTKRLLEKGGVRARSLRGFERNLPPAIGWPVVVVIHHPQEPSTPFPPSDDTLFVALDDWLGLHEMVRSTAALVDYVHRALASGIVVPLGAESQRYQILAAADARWAAKKPNGVPMLPARRLDPVARRNADLFDDLIGKVADPLGATGWDEQQYLYIVEQLDRVPVRTRAELGGKMWLTFKAMWDSRARRSFTYADRESGARLCFLYDYFDESIYGSDAGYLEPRTATYALLRHHQATAAGLDDSGSTLAVGVLHHPKSGTRYAFALFQGDVPTLPDDLRLSLEDEFGIFTGDSVVRSGEAG